MLQNIPINRFPRSGKNINLLPLVHLGFLQPKPQSRNLTFSRNNDGNLEEDEFIKVGSADKILVCVHFSMGLLQEYLFLHRVAWQMRSSWIC